MPDQKIKEIRDNCKLDCLCKSCGNEHIKGFCFADGGNCMNTREAGMCPVTKCAALTTKTNYTIADKARELREAFREQYGVEVDIQIYVHDSVNPQINKETAERMGKEMAGVFQGQLEMEHGKGTTAKWFEVNYPEERVQIALFYDKEEPHEQSN